MSTRVQLLSVKPGLLGVFPVFLTRKILVLHRSSQLLLFRIRVCSLGFSDNFIRVVLDRCCLVPKHRGLSTGIYRFAGFRLVYVRGFLLFSAQGTHSAAAPWGPSQELAFQVPHFYCARGMLWDAVIRGVGYGQAERKALNVSLRVGGHGGTDARRLLSWGSRRVCFTCQGHEDDSLAIFLIQAERSLKGDTSLLATCLPGCLLISR